MNREIYNGLAIGLFELKRFKEYASSNKFKFLPVNNNANLQRLAYFIGARDEITLTYTLNVEDNNVVVKLFGDDSSKLSELEEKIKKEKS